MAKSDENMSSQIVMTSKTKRPNSSLPFAFTEHGVAMLSNVLKKDKKLISQKQREKIGF
jgi:hypothetical protein